MSAVFSALLGSGFWRTVTLQMLCWKARVVIALLAAAAVLDWMR